MTSPTPDPHIPEPDPVPEPDREPSHPDTTPDDLPDPDDTGTRGVVDDLE